MLYYYKMKNQYVWWCIITVIILGIGWLMVFNGTKESMQTQTQTQSKQTQQQNTSYYNHYNKTNANILYGPNGSTLVVHKNADGKTTLEVIRQGQNVAMYTLSSYDSRFNGPNNSYANIATDNNGQLLVDIVLPNGDNEIYMMQPSYSDDQKAKEKENMTNTQYYGSTGYKISSAPSSLAYSASFSADPNVHAPTEDHPSDGIKKADIPHGQNDLYILKTMVLPPDCPQCDKPIISSQGSNGNVNRSENNTGDINYNTLPSDVVPFMALPKYTTFGT